MSAVVCSHLGTTKFTSKHAHQVSHPIIRSAEPAEDWSWC
jgi:hypothetical protein